MELKKFITNLKSYYGDYERIVELTLMDYIDKNFHKSELDKLFRVITDEYTNVYKTPPDKARIIEIVENYNEVHHFVINGLLGIKYRENAKITPTMKGGVIINEKNNLVIDTKQQEKKSSTYIKKQ